MSTTTITRQTEVYDLSDEYKLAEEFTLTTTPSTDETVTKIKELLIKLTEKRVIGNTEENAWGSLLLDMVCLKAANRSNWQRPIAHLLPALRRLGSEAQVEQALTEFAADNAPTFTTIEEFEWGRVGGLYWEPHYWWGFLKQYATPELKKAFFEKMDDFCSEWEPTTPELEEEFAEVDVAAAHIAAVKEARQRAEERLKACTPVQVGMTREEYLAAYQASLSGETDVTGVMAAIKQLNMPEQSERRMKYYIQQRIESPTSPVGQKLVAATEGEEVIALVTGLFQSGKYNRVRLPEEPEVVAVKPSDPEVRYPAGVFQDALDNCFFENVFAEAEGYKELILGNIDEIASNFCEGNEFEATGEEPQWLLSALLKAGAEFGSGDGSYDDGDDDEITTQLNYQKQSKITLWYYHDECELIFDMKSVTLDSEEAALAFVADNNDGSGHWQVVKYAIHKEDGTEIKLADDSELFRTGVNWSNEIIYGKDDPNFVEAVGGREAADAITIDKLKELVSKFHTVPSAAEQKNEEPGTEFNGKRVCITGKLETTRDVWEAWIKDAGGIVASSVSKTTDILIVGKDAGSKLDKAKELGINIIDESAAKFTLGFICEEIQEAWAELIIEKLLSGLPTIEGEGYFRINDGNQVYVENTDSTALIKDWLALRIGANSDLSEYSYPEEVEKLKVEWVVIDKTNNVTAWYYDNECSDMGSPLEVIVNNTQDAHAYLDGIKDGWGGHLSTIKVIEKTGDSIKVLVGEELVKANYRCWDSDIDDVLDNLGAYPELCDLLSNEPEDAGKELEEIIRKGLWPHIKK